MRILILSQTSATAVCEWINNFNSNLDIHANITWTWWHYQMETFSASLVFFAGNTPVTGEIPAQRPATRSFEVFFHLLLNKQLSKQPWGWWFETLLRPLWRHCNEAKWLKGATGNITRAFGASSLSELRIQWSDSTPWLRRASDYAIYVIIIFKT